MALTFPEALAAVRKDLSPGDVHVDSADNATPGAKTRRRRGTRVVADNAAPGTLDNPRSPLGKDAWRIEVPITKTQDDQRLVFGWASVIEEGGVPVIDSQGDVIAESDLEKAFYGFAQEARAAGEMHQRHGRDVGEMVECMVFTKEKQAALGIDLGKVGAWVGFRLEPDLFAKVKSGDYRAFSFGGVGRRVPL